MLSFYLCFNAVRMMPLNRHERLRVNASYINVYHETYNIPNKIDEPHEP